MTRSGTRSSRRRRGGKPLTGGGLLRRLLALPARLRLRWLVIVIVMAAFTGAYTHVLTTAPPMPPSQAPAGVPSAGASATPSHGAAARATLER